MAESEIREFVWGVKPLDVSDPEEALNNAQKRIVEKFVIGKDVRLSVPAATPVTPQMIKMFCGLGSKAAQSKRKFHLRVPSCVARVVEQIPESGAIILEPV